MHVAKALQQARRQQGATLQDAAGSAGLSVDDAARIERGDLAGFGSRARAKALVRAYGAGLGVETEPLLLQIDETWPAQRPEPTLPPAAQAPPPAAPIAPDETAAVTPAEPAVDTPAQPAPITPATPAEAAAITPDAPGAPGTTVPIPPGGDDVPQHSSLLATAHAGSVRHAAHRQPRRWRRLIVVATLAAVVGVILLLAGRFTDARVALEFQRELTEDPTGIGDEPALPALPGNEHVDASPDLDGTIVAGGPLARMLAAAEHTSVQVLDGTDEPDRFDDAVAVLRELGYDIVATGRSRQRYERTTVFHNRDWQAEAEQLQSLDARFAVIRVNDRGLSEDIALHIVVGADWRPAAGP